MLNKTVSVWGTERKPWTGYCEITRRQRKKKRKKKNWSLGWISRQWSDDGTFDRWNYAWIDLRRGSQTASFVILAPITGATSSADCKSLSFPATRARWSFYTSESGVIVEEQRAWLLLRVLHEGKRAKSAVSRRREARSYSYIGDIRYNSVYIYIFWKTVWERNFLHVIKFRGKEEEK